PNAVNGPIVGHVGDDSEAKAQGVPQGGEQSGRTDIGDEPLVSVELAERVADVEEHDRNARRIHQRLIIQVTSARTPSGAPLSAPRTVRRRPPSSMVSEYVNASGPRGGPGGASGTFQRSAAVTSCSNVRASARGRVAASTTTDRD